MKISSVLTNLQVIDDVEPVIEKSLVIEMEPQWLVVVEVLVDGPALVVGPSVHDNTNQMKALGKPSLKK